MATTSTNTGKVKFFNDQKKYGFIIDDNEVDNKGEKKQWFFHIVDTLDKVNKDDLVAYDIEPTDRGEKAVNVKRVKT